MDPNDDDNQIPKKTSKVELFGGLPKTVEEINKHIISFQTMFPSGQAKEITSNKNSMIDSFED